MPVIPDFLSELKRRRVYRTGIAYLAGAFVLWQAAEILVPVLGLSDALLRVVVVGSLVGLPVALVLSWLYDVMPGHAKGGDAAEAAGRRLPLGKALALGLGSGLVTLLALGVWLRLSGRDATPPGANLARLRVAVAPFEARGTDDVRVLGEGVVDLVYMSLDGVAGIRVVEPRSTLAVWRNLADPGLTDEELGREIGRRTGAEVSITGRIVQAGDDLRIDVDVRSADGVVIASHRAEGPLDSALALVDELSLAVFGDLLRGEDGEEIDLRALASGSPEAIGAYLRATRDFRGGQFASAVATFQEALAVDTTFALAYVGLADAYGWSGRHGQPEQTEAIAAAARHRDRLPPREARLVRGYELNALGDEVAVDSLRAYVEAYPDDPRGWYALGDFQYHSAAATRLPADELTRPFETALGLDSLFLPALLHPMDLALGEGDRARYERWLETYEHLGGKERQYRTIARALWGSEAEARAAMDSLATSGVGDLFGLALFGQRPDRLPALVALMTRGDATLNVRYVAAVLAMPIGRLAFMEDQITEIEALDVAGELGLLLRTIAVAGGAAPVSVAVPLLERLEGVSTDWGHYFRAIVALRVGDPSIARESLDRLPSSTTEATRARVAALRGWANVMDNGGADALEALREGVAGLPPAQFGVSQLDNVLRLELARALVVAPETRAEGLDRLRVLADPRAGVFAPHRAAVTLLAETLEAEGEQEEALRRYRRVVELLGGSDPELREELEAAEAAVARLSGA